VVGVNELTMRSQTIVSQNFLFIPVLAASGAIYILMSACLAGVQWWLESRYGLEFRARRAKRRAAKAEKPRPFDLFAALRRPRSENALPALDVRDLEVAYGNKPVLKNLSLQVARGEVVALLGRSGSGKSTLLKSVVALSPVRAGSITVSGHAIGVDPQGRRLSARQLPANRAASHVGIVFQHFALFDHMTALENVMSIPTIVQHEGRAIARDKAHAALEAVGLGAFADRLPHELSGGQQQRVAIARALAGQPELLLFDEPTSALDPELVREVNATIRKLARSGMTMVISTHDVDFAAKVADRIVFLQGGELIEQGPPSIIAEPATSEFRAYLRQERDTGLDDEEIEADKV
jgi:polar amino acid transport system permease protein